MITLLDSQADVVISCKVNSKLDVPDTGSIHNVCRKRCDFALAQWRSDVQTWYGTGI
jgi:hypothetical protein